MGSSAPPGSCSAAPSSWGFRYVGPGAAPALGSIVQPVALYDLLLVAVLAAVLVRFLRRAHPPGSAAALFALWYATERLLRDFLRTDPRWALGLTGTRLASIAVIGVAGAWLAWHRRAVVISGP